MKPLRLLAAFAVMLVLALAVNADDQKGQKGDKKGKGTAGMVERVDAGGKTFVVRTGKKKDPTAESVTITFTDQTQFLIRDADNPKGKAATLGDLATGKRVNVVVEEKDGKKIATRVLIVVGKKG